MRFFWNIFLQLNSIIKSKLSNSTYYDKCQRSPENSLNQEKAQLQKCQHQLLNAIKEIRKENSEIAVPANYYTLRENAEERKLLNENFEILKTISFDEYVECLSIILTGENVDGHFEKQYKSFDLLKQNPFYYPMKVFKKTNIFKLENIDLGWNEVCEKLEMKMDLRKINKMHPMRTNIKQLYTNETREMVAKLYKIDFVKFKYPLDL